MPDFPANHVWWPLRVCFCLVVPLRKESEHVQYQKSCVLLISQWIWGKQILVEVSFHGHPMDQTSGCHRLGWVLLVEGICATWGTPTATNIAIGNYHLWMICPLEIKWWFFHSYVSLLEAIVWEGFRSRTFVKPPNVSKYKCGITWKTQW